jgi:hypothetical protein
VGTPVPTSGIRAEPGIGGATPTIVPLSLLGPGGRPAGRGGPPGAGGGAAPGGGIIGGAAPGGGAGAAPGAIGGAPPWPCIISIVPLNFGAAAPLRLKLHFVQF